MNRHFTEEEKNIVANKHVERDLALLVTKEKQMNTTKIHNCIPIRLAEINTFDSVKCQRECGSINVHIYLGKQLLCKYLHIQ